MRPGKLRLAIRLGGSDGWRTTCCRLSEVDAVGRALRACPFAAKGYQPPPEPERPEQEVHLLGAEWWRGRTCPVAVVTQDPVVGEILADFEVLDRWAKGETLESWRQRPAWWCQGMREVQRMRDIIEAEALKPDAHR